MNDRKPGPIYIVENDEAVRQSLRLLLEVEGYCVEEFASAEALLKVSAKHDAACLILDYQLGGMTGLALLEQLRSDGVHTPALLVTAHDGSLEGRYPRAHVSKVLQKPAAPADLLGWVRQVTAAP